MGELGELGGKLPLVSLETLSWAKSSPLNDSLKV